MSDLSIFGLPSIPALDAADVFPITDLTDTITKKGTVGQLDGRYVGETDVAAKGDMFVATADDTVGVLTVGANDRVLQADSATATGVKWGVVLLPANNLSDLADAATARTNLGVDFTTLDERTRDVIGVALVAGSGISVTPNDGSDTIVIATTGGGGGASLGLVSAFNSGLLTAL